MMRLLCFVLLLGCVADTKAEHEALATWLDAWAVARSCLVAPADDIETGAAISILEARDCRNALAALELLVPATGDPLLTWWRTAISRLSHLDERSAARRTAEIVKVDAGARTLAALSGRTPSITPRAIPMPRLTMRMRARRDWNTRDFRRSFVFVGAGPMKTAVTWPARDERRFAFGVTISRDDGVSWKHYDYEGRLVAQRHYIADEAHELVVERNAHLELHQVLPDGNPPTRKALELSPRATWICHHTGVTWGLLDGRIVRSDSAGTRALGPAVKGTQLRCNAGAAVVDAPDQVYRCRGQGCRRELASPVPDLPGHAAILDDGRWMFVLEHESVAAIWIEGEKGPRYFRANDVNWRDVLQNRALLEGAVVPFAPISSRSFEP